MRSEECVYYDKLLRSPILNKSGNNIRFLQYLKIMANRGLTHKITEKTIAFDVFNKHADYDPNYNASIRVFFHRFKKNLQLYYLMDGINDDYELIFLSGTYMPKLVKRSQYKVPLSTTFPKKTGIHEKILCSLLTHFSISMDETYIDAIIEYFEKNDLSAKKDNSYELSVFSEALIHKHTMFQTETRYPIGKILDFAEQAYDLNPEEEQSIFTLVVSGLYSQDKYSVLKYSDILSGLTEQPYYYSLAVMANALITNSRKATAEIDRIISQYNPYPPYLDVPMMLSKMRNNNIIDAIRYAKRFHSSQSFSSKIFIMLLKARINKLDSSDERFISDNSQFFTEKYLTNFLFEQGAKFSLT